MWTALSSNPENTVFLLSATVFLLPALVLIAALLIRVGVDGTKSPGTVRQEWRFLRNGRAMGTGLVTLLITIGVAWPAGSPGVLLWALLVGLLVAFIVDRLLERSCKSASHRWRCE